MMIVCCIPMLVIAGALVLSGVANGGAIIFALACTAMMVGMGHGGQKWPRYQHGQHGKA